MNGRVLALVLLSGWMLATPSAFAKPLAPNNASRKADAQRHFDAGAAHYKAHEFVEAAAEFEAAYAITATPQYLFNIASAYRLAQDWQQSLDYYKRYLEALPDAPNRTAVEQRITEVSALIPPPAPPPRQEPVRQETPPELTPPPPKPRRQFASETPKTPYELGVRVRYLFVTRLMLSPYLDASTQLNSGSFGVEFVYHRKNFDVVTSLDFSGYNVDDGNYLTAGHDANSDTHYTQFRKTSMLSADVSIIGHHDFNKWFQLRGGAGLGVGVVFGDVLLTNSWSACTKKNAHDLTMCHPALNNWDAKHPEPSLKASETNGQSDGPGSPHRHVTKDKPPAMGVLNILIGARFNLPHKFTVDVELGFRDAMFFGVGAHYRF